LPWVKTELSNLATDNFAPLVSLDWQVHIYDEATPEIRAECDARTLKMHIFPCVRGCVGAAYGAMPSISFDLMATSHSPMQTASPVP
jgi:hypothetical protein